MLSSNRVGKNIFKSQNVDILNRPQTATSRKYIVKSEDKKTLPRGHHLTSSQALLKKPKDNLMKRLDINLSVETNKTPIRHIKFHSLTKDEQTNLPDSYQNLSTTARTTYKSSDKEYGFIGKVNKLRPKTSFKISDPNLTNSKYRVSFGNSIDENESIKIEQLNDNSPEKVRRSPIKIVHKYSGAILKLQNHFKNNITKKQNPNDTDKAI